MMSSRTSSMGDPGVVTTLAMLWVCGPVAAQTIIPIEQDRSVSNEQVNAPQCTGDFLFDGEAAIGFDPFDALVKTQGLSRSAGQLELTAGRRPHIIGILDTTAAPDPNASCSLEGLGAGKHWKRWAAHGVHASVTRTDSGTDAARRH